VAKLHIPKQYREGIAALVRLDDLQSQSFLAHIADVKPGISASEFAQQSAITNLDNQTVAKMFDALESLYRVRSAENLSPEAFAERVLDGMVSSGDEQLSFGADSRDSVRRRLVRLLNTEAFAIASKVARLSYDFERTFCSSKVLTDLRPVFSDDPTAPPVGYMVINTLKLDYHENGDTGTMFIGMSEEDLRILRDTVNRAIEKSETLRSKISSSEWGHIDGRDIQ
jgi:hypothetical protein